jgi:hypothetical protein
MWYLPTDFQKIISKLLTTRPYNFIIIWTNEFRRALALCAAVRGYRQYALSTPYYNEMIMPTILGGLTLCTGGLLFPFYERELLPYSVSMNKVSVLDAVPWRVRLPFICAFYYNLCFLYNLQTILPFDAEIVVVLAFMALPTIEYINAKINASMNK